MNTKKSNSIVEINIDNRYKGYLIAFSVNIDTPPLPNQKWFMPLIIDNKYYKQIKNLFPNDKFIEAPEGGFLCSLISVDALEFMKPLNGQMYCCPVFDNYKDAQKAYQCLTKIKD